MNVTDTAQLQYNNAKLNSQLQKMQNGRLSDEEAKKLKKSCQDFESLFVKQMLDSMRKTVDKSDMLNGGMAEDIFEDMLYSKYADSMTANSNFGIAKMMYKQLSGT